jgi:Zn-dependent protease
MPNLSHIDLDFLIKGLLWYISFIGQISVHEAAHAWMAWKRGDGTAKYQGRMTLDPGAHIDAIGTILMPMLMIFFSIPVIGWARPVPVYAYYLNNPLRDMMFVALAGPVSNLILAALFLILFKIFFMIAPVEVSFAAMSAVAGGELVPPGTDFFVALPRILGFILFVSIIINVMLASFNMIPVPPLDGSKVLAYFLNDRMRDILYSLERYGFIIILGLLWLGGLRLFILPIMEFTGDLIALVIRL